MQNISMSVEMTKAILDGRKVRFSEAIKENIEKATVLSKSFPYSHTDKNYKLTMVSEKEIIRKFAKYQIGETIEVFKQVDCIGDCNVGIPCQSCGSSQGIGVIEQSANILLKITNVRVERLQDISGLDCLAEGLVEVSKDGFLHKYCLYDKKDYSSTPWQDMPKVPQEAYKALWNKTAPKGYRWDDNPYVFVYEFGRVER